MTPCRNPHRTAPPLRIAVCLSLGLVLGQLPIMAIPAVIVDLAKIWHLDEAQIGWLGGIYFAGYAVGLPILSGATNRMDGRLVYAVCALVAGLASFGVAVLADGFWSALALRFFSGIGFAGIHIVGMKLLADRLTGPAQARAGAYYSAAYAIGSGASFIVGGVLADAVGWEGAFVAAGIGSLLAAPILLFIGPATSGAEIRQDRWLPDFRAAIRETAAMRYVIAYAGNTWEVFAIRVWFVPFLAFSAGMNGEGTVGWSPAILAGMAAILAVPVSIFVAEIGVGAGRRRAIRITSILSVSVCLVLGWLADAPYALALALLFVHAATSYGDAGAINGGVVAASRPETRNAILALFGLFGFISGFLGPMVVGLVLDAMGGALDARAWFWGFFTMALGSVVAAVFIGKDSPVSLPPAPPAGRSRWSDRRHA